MHEKRKRTEGIHMEGRKLKVLQLGKQYYPHVGGIEVTMQQIAEGIQEQVEVSVLVSQECGSAREEVVNGVPVYYAKSLGVVASLPISLDLIRYLCKHVSQYDIIHLHMPFPIGDLACFLAGFKGKLVLYWHSDVIRQKKAMFFYKPLMNWTLRRADAIAIASQRNIDGSPYVKPYESKCVRIPFGLRKEWEKRADFYCERGRDESDPNNPQRLNLLFIGRLVYYKGCDVLIKAMELLKEKQDNEMDIQLRIVGTGTLEEELKQCVKESVLKGNVEFLGKISDESMEREIKNCDVFVFPSIANSEAFGLAQLETMIFGKPVINTWLPTGVPYVSLDRETGLTVPPGDATALADAICWMQQHPTERKEMGKRARIRVKEEFTEEKLLGRIVGLYEELCKS